MQNESLTSLPKSSSSAFTLIELIVVIIIVGILAAVGISQYSKMVEKGRGAEARMIIGQIRKLAYEYYLQNGSYDGITAADVGVGATSDQIPSACRSTHYFMYANALTWTTTNSFYTCAQRCSSGGKTPQWSGSDPWLCYSDSPGTAGLWSGTSKDVKSNW